MEITDLKCLERLYLTAVLDECLVQMSILSHIQLPSKDRGFSFREGLNTMKDKDIEELQNNRKENESMHIWQKATNLARPTVLLNALIAMIWNKMILFRKLSKVGREHKLLELVIIATRNEIEDKGSFSCLVTVVSEQKLRKKVEDIREHTIQTGRRLVELSNQRAQLTQECRKNLETHNEIVDILKRSKKVLNSRALYDFTREKKFCDAHEEQEIKKMLVWHDGLVDDLNSCIDDKIEEDVLTKTIHSFLNRRHVQLEGMLEYWMDRYERQLEERLKNLEHLRNERSKQWDVTFWLLKRFTDFNNLVEDYKKDMLELELRSTRQKRKESAAVVIEAWWRGLMVQKHLGPFRTKRPGKGDKKGKKK